MVSQSMTGHGQAQRVCDGVGCLVELRGVNHRFLDVNLRGTAISAPLERTIREKISERVGRGRVEVLLSSVIEEKRSAPIEADSARVDTILEVYRAEFERCGLSFDDKKIQQKAMLQVMQRADVFIQAKTANGQVEAWEGMVLEALSDALEQFCSSRLTEGARLVLDVRGRAARLMEFHGSVSARAPLVSENYRDRLKQRLQRLGAEGEVSAERIAQEAAVLAERVDITEELVRFAGHLDELEKTLVAIRSGRRLDFIVQELGREVNTIGSKAQDGVIQGIVINIKAELERIREQIQNLE